jgi:hypothetical protein
VKEAGVSSIDENSMSVGGWRRHRAGRSGSGSEENRSDAEKDSAWNYEVDAGMRKFSFLTIAARTGISLRGVHRKNLLP